MIVHVANGVLTAGSHARVCAFVANAGPILWTIVVQHALWSTEFVRVSSILGEAIAYAIIAFRVRAAGRGVARV